MRSYQEATLELLPGPTYQFGGLSWGNLASCNNQAFISYPKKTALQSLEKMRLLDSLGCTQLLLAPHIRPDISFLKTLGFSGNDQAIIDEVAKKAPHLLSQVSSSSFMWPANNATITPSCDSLDNKVHITVANAATNLHRSIEASFTRSLFENVFSSKNHFVIHKALPATYALFDEGAANHVRLWGHQDKQGIHLFVYGRSEDKGLGPQKYPARQTKMAQESIRRRHMLSQSNCLFAQQNPVAIDHGVFHNDVISMGHKLLFLVHEEAFIDTEKTLDELQAIAKKQLKRPLFIKVVKNTDLDFSETIASYLFNCQIITSPVSKKTFLIAPEECKKIEAAKRQIDQLIDDPSIPIEKAFYVPLDQSMPNGGGPNCLRLQFLLNEEELKSIKRSIFFSETLYQKIRACVEEYYPETFMLCDLQDPTVRENAFVIVKKIANILGLSSFSRRGNPHL